MRLIEARSPADAWIQASQVLLKEGNNLGDINEILNLVIEIDPRLSFDKLEDIFDEEFRNIFGDERIDYAKSVTFVKPDESPLAPGEFMYKQNDTTVKWNKTYWGRLINWHDEFNQIEQVIKRLKEGKNSKTIVAQVFDPKSDGRKTMAGMPCLLSMDFKPRDGELFMTAFFRSQAVSKSGYADYTALVEMGNFICEQTDLILSRVTNIAGSGHIRNQNDEKKNTIKLLEAVGCAV